MSASDKVWVNNQSPDVDDQDYNGFNLENNNLIEGSSQTLSTGDNQQTHKAVSAYSVVGDVYTVAGIADAYTLTAVAPRLAPQTLLTGMQFRGIVNITNTGASTVNPFGQGVKNIKLDEAGSIDPVAGDLAAGIEAIFTSRAAGHVQLINPQVTEGEKQIGVGQTWQDLKASRSINVVYTNTTGKPIQVAVIGFVSSGIAFFEVDGIEVGAMIDDGAITQRGFTSAIVPDGSTYKMNTGTGATIDKWAELR